MSLDNYTTILDNEDMRQIVQRHDIGDLKVISYEFFRAGCILKKDSINRLNEHITFVMRGKVRVSSIDWEMDVEAGSVIVYNPDEPYELVSLENDTKIMNILKHFDGKITRKEIEGR